jgi:hypothetical protein
VHRSRLSMLVILAATAAACSKKDPTEGADPLAQDRALVARLEVDQETRQQPLPPACGTVALAAQPALANQQQARELTRQARDAEMQGNVKEARALLLRASELDGTSKSTAYHLGRTSEALGDRAAAIAAYCRYLALTPTTPEAVEAHQRLTKLAQPVTRVAAGTLVDTTPTARKAPVARAISVAPAPARRVTREQPKAAPRVVASAPVERRAPAPSREREPSPASMPASGAEVASAPSEPAVTPREADSSSGGTTAGGDVVATTAAEQAGTQQPAAEQPSTAPRTSRRVPSRAQSAGIGAGMGAIIGAATGRSVKSAVIGAAAGGILGTVVGSGMSPIGRSITPYAGGR